MNGRRERIALSARASAHHPIPGARHNALKTRRRSQVEIVVLLHKDWRLSPALGRSALPPLQRQLPIHSNSAPSADLRLGISLTPLQKSRTAH